MLERQPGPQRTADGAGERLDVVASGRRQRGRGHDVGPCGVRIEERVPYPRHARGPVDGDGTARSLDPHRAGGRVELQVAGVRVLLDPCCRGLHPGRERDDVDVPARGDPRTEDRGRQPRQCPPRSVAAVRQSSLDRRIDVEAEPRLDRADGQTDTGRAHGDRSALRLFEDGQQGPARLPPVLTADVDTGHLGPRQDPAGLRDGEEDKRGGEHADADADTDDGTRDSTSERHGGPARSTGRDPSA